MGVPSNSNVDVLPMKEEKRKDSDCSTVLRKSQLGQ